jgi:hypothetical protein
MGVRPSCTGPSDRSVPERATRTSPSAAVLAERPDVPGGRARASGVATVGHRPASNAVISPRTPVADTLHGAGER